MKMKVVKEQPKNKIRIAYEVKMQMALIGEALGDNRFASNRLWQKRKKT